MMMNEKMQKIGKFIRENCAADDFTLHINNSQTSATRFAQNAITHNMGGENTNLYLEVTFGTKTGAVSGNIFDEKSLQQLIKTAESIASLNQPDPEFVASEGAHKLPETTKTSHETISLSSEKMVDNIAKCVENAKHKDANISGISEKEISKNYMLTKNGFEGFDEEAVFSHSMTMKKDGKETKVSKSVNDFNNFSMENQLNQLNLQFDSLDNPVSMEKGRMPVILRPAAVLNWLHYLAWGFNLRSADDGLTPFTGKLGKQVFGEKFNLYSRQNQAKISAPSFFSNGLPVRDIDWIKNGVIQTMSSNRFYANKKGILPAQFYNFIVDGENISEKEMMKKVKRGVIVNSLWYIRSTDQKVGEQTGLTRDGVLYFEDGEIVKSVKNFRWNEILHDATKRIIALGESVHQSYYAKIPTMLIDDFNFVDVTTF
ncbi:MAG: hypothetical protein HN952_02640 [Candidatus Cloacimonetes bacterium]|jgi:predicted Zn-dependent protease|nr:hypothetical protein [Candidatus Cloacimonadota bacterium]MBT6993831.1 hypothetical protein [Candidatus Cloacimonadota bacterium]